MLDYEGKYGFGKAHERMVDWIAADSDTAARLLLEWACSTPPATNHDAGGYGAGCERYERLITMLEQAAKRAEP